MNFLAAIARLRVPYASLELAQPWLEMGAESLDAGSDPDSKLINNPADQVWVPIDLRDSPDYLVFEISDRGWTLLSDSLVDLSPNLIV